MYYLQSRYYDPELGRFINADVYASTGQGVLGNNMFAYCLNNPVNRMDIGGNCSDYSCDPDLHSARDFGKWLGQKLQEFLDKLSDDDEKYDEENTDIDEVYESYYFSSFNGTLVVRHRSKLLTSWALGGIIFLNHDLDNYSDALKEQYLNHEYGHIQQEKDYGTLAYVFIIFIPSVMTNALSRFNPNAYHNYYNMPWEYDADMRGNVQRDHAWWAEYTADFYFTFWG